jgi:hypothetical protein
MYYANLIPPGGIRAIQNGLSMGSGMGGQFLPTATGGYGSKAVSRDRPLLAESSQSLTAKFGCQLFFLPKRTSSSRLLQPRRELQWVRLLNATNTPAYMVLPMACS